MCWTRQRRRWNRSLSSENHTDWRCTGPHLWRRGRVWSAIRRGVAAVGVPGAQSQGVRRGDPLAWGAVRASARCPNAARTAGACRVTIVGFKPVNHPQQIAARGGVACDDTDDRRTTPDVFAPWNARYRFTLDAAANAD